MVFFTYKSLTGRFTWGSGSFEPGTPKNRSLLPLEEFEHELLAFEQRRVLFAGSGVRGAGLRNLRFRLFRFITVVCITLGLTSSGRFFCFLF